MQSGRGLEATLGSRAGRRPAEPRDQPSPAEPASSSGDLLLDDGGQSARGLARCWEPANAGCGSRPSAPAATTGGTTTRRRPRRASPAPGREATRRRDPRRRDLDLAEGPADDAHGRGAVGRPEPHARRAAVGVKLEGRIAAAAPQRSGGGSVRVAPRPVGPPAAAAGETYRHRRSVRLTRGTTQDVGVSWATMRACPRCSSPTSSRPRAKSRRPDLGSPSATRWRPSSGEQSLTTSRSSCRISPARHASRRTGIGWASLVGCRICP